MNHRKITAIVLNLVLAFGIAITTLPAQAAVPQTLSYQGQLTNAAGVPVNGPVSITFKLYDAGTGGAVLWSETQNVTVSNGLYSIKLGQITSLSPSLFGAGLYLGITVETDAEMTPRIALSSAPYAMQSSCTPGDQMDCYTGASATRNVGACKSGKRNCTSTGWGSTCDGEVLPVAEVLNGIDDDCNGVIDNGVGCFIGGVGYANGAANSANSCQVCNMSLTTTAWSNKAVGTACSDGSVCTTGDACDGAGSCVGTPVNVNDNNACTTDTCDPVSGVSHAPVQDGSSCGAAANGSLTCSKGMCAGIICMSGFADCNRNPADGCEANVYVDTNNCGSCGHACASGQACVAGACFATAPQCTINADCAGTNTACQTSTCNAGQCVVAYAPSTTVCRASAGACDIAEHCSGTSGVCPTDSFAPPTTVCRASAGACDVAEYCSGTSANCPANSFAPDGTACGASLACQSGVCQTAAALTIAPSSTDYGSVAVGANTAMTFTVTNIGGSTSGVLSVSLTGMNPNQFLIAGNTCTGNTLVATTTCTVAVAFNPNSAGAKSATFSVTATPGGAASAMLAGTGF